MQTYKGSSGLRLSTRKYIVLIGKTPKKQGKRIYESLMGGWIENLILFKPDYLSA